MSDVLAEICETKRAHVARLKDAVPYDRLVARAEAAGAVRPFAETLKKAAAKGTGLIAEIKRASPSKGRIREFLDPEEIARDYAAGGAACLSVLTDTPYFHGGPEDLQLARDAVDLPVLRKDFILDPYQIPESRAMGADCILLIMAALADGEARELETLAMEFGMDVLVEVHDGPELDRALALQSPLIGINNRDLRTMSVSLDTAIDLARRVPDDRLVIAESGIHTHADIARLQDAGIHAFLVGESLMRKADVTRAVHELLGSAA